MLPILILVFIASIVFAGPFGLSKGMSLSEVSKLSEKGYEPKSIANDDRYAFIPQKKHEFFKNYLAFIDEEKGLYRINAISEEIRTTGYGTELKNTFYAMVERISKIYGKPKITDRIDSNYYLKKEEYWLTALKDGARELYATWDKGEKYTNLPEELESVSIYASAEFSYGYIIIKYHFSNSSEIHNKQDDVL